MSIRDVFYYGKKPNVHPREKFAINFEDAKNQNTTEHFWIINEYCDYTNFDWDFDFDFLPDDEVWTQDHINIWPSHHQKDSGTWLCSENCTDIKIYKSNADPIQRKNIIVDNWVILENIDKSKFDLTWHPDPTDPPYIYRWGCKFFPVEVKHVLEYKVDGATEVKYMDRVIELLPNDYWIENQQIDKSKFDLTWRPDPREPAYIYVWGNKHIEGNVSPTLTYKTPGATEIKYMGELVEVIPEYDRYKILIPIDKNSFDFSWRPNPYSPPYIYVFGNQWHSAEIEPTIEYHVPGATDKKYINDVVARTLPDMEKWKDLTPIKKFDYSWRPDPHSPPYIYVFGNQWHSAEIEPTIEYHVPNAIDRKYINDIIAETLPLMDNWKTLIPVDNFDYSWRPDPHSPPYIYVFGNQWHNAEIEPTIEFHVPNATHRKYIDDIIATTSSVKDNWNNLIEIEKFDYSWRPDPHSPPYIYVFGNQWHSAEIEPTIEYHVPNATEKKYIHDIIAEVAPTDTNWKTLIPVDNFDYSWRPDPHSPPYIYVFGNQWHSATIEPTIEYHVPGATDRKYIDEIIATVSPTTINWKTLIPVDNFDYSWRPDPHSPPYIYVFGNQWHSAEIEPTVEYHVDGATEKKYIHDIVALSKYDPFNKAWKQLIDIESFDYSWRPDPHSPPYIYVFGNKWHDAATEPSIEYHVSGATERKYIEYPVAIPKADLNYWQVSNKDDLETFDFSWRPNPHSPPQIYQWDNNGPRYTVPDSTEIVYMERTDEFSRKPLSRYYIKTTLDDLINEHIDEVFWVLNPDLNYDKFDFNWKPDDKNFRHINVFGNEYSKNTQTYFVNGPMYALGYKDFNYVEGQTVKIDSSTLDIFFVDRSNNKSQERFDLLKQKYPQLQKTRYLNSWVDTINRCVTKASTKFIWILSSELDYSDFVLDFYPSPWQEKMVHVFGTQWSHWGNTYLINTETFPVDTKYVKIIEHLNVLNFVKSKKAKATDVLYDVIYINHGNMTDIEGKFVIPYKDNYLTTFRHMLQQLPNKKEHYVWVVSSICDYNNFDFTYICDPFAKEQLHVFPSDKQKFGDTFLVNVNKLRELVDNMTMLEDYNKVNFNQHQRVTRLPAPVFVTSDTHTSNLKDDYDFPYAVYITKDNTQLTNIKDSEPISLWNNQKDILITSTGGTRIVAPKIVKSVVKTELYDYPFINKTSKLTDSKPLDIVFFSNGEVGADENYEHLVSLTASLGNRVVRVDGIQGRVASQHAAANASETPWYFLVNAKLRVNEKFDFNWQPDRLQIPKHYIFLATNPVNGLEYGHQAIVANNKTLTLNTDVKGLDFTMDSEHEVVNINSGVGMFNTSPWDTWRTAFREVIKLRNSDSEESKHRLNAWLTIANGDFAQFSLQGAKDAVDYYESVNGDFEKLKLSYDWAWLRDYFENK